MPSDHTEYIEEEFTRDTAYIEDRIVASPTGEFEWPVEADRYRLAVAHACPWANRTLITRRLLGLEGLDLAGHGRSGARLGLLDLRPRPR